MKNKITLVSIFLFLPFFAMADAGTPMLYFGLFHLVFINAAIGMIESSILLMYKIKHTFWKILLANYISMIAGMFLAAPLLSKSLYHIDFWSGESFVSQSEAQYNREHMITVIFGLIVSFLLTLLIEYPFFKSALKDKADIARLKWPFLVANIATNAGMLLLYLFFALSF